MRTLRRRWSDDDHHFGPLTLARDGSHYRPLAVVLESGDDECVGCQLRVSGFGVTVILGLPPVLRPHRRWVDTSDREWSLIPGSGYWEISNRRYGFSCDGGFLQVFHGRQSNDSRECRTRSLFLPWRQWRHARRSFFGLAGEHVGTVRTRRTRVLGLADHLARMDEERAIADATPVVRFWFDDFDGERICATTRLEERGWLLGEGWFRWLSWFAHPRVVRSLDLRFSSEVGRRKGSWKGGTVGHSIAVRPGELHEAAFRRYCAENELTFVGADR